MLGWAPLKNSPQKYCDYCLFPATLKVAGALQKMVWYVREFQYWYFISSALFQKMQVSKWTLLHAASKSQSPAQKQVHQNGARYLYSGYICLVYSCSSLFLSFQCQYWIDPSESSRMCKKMGWDVDSIEESNARVLGFKECLGRPGWTDGPWPRDLAHGRVFMANCPAWSTESCADHNRVVGASCPMVSSWYLWRNGQMPRDTCRQALVNVIGLRVACFLTKVHCNVKECIKSPYYKVKRDGAVLRFLMISSIFGTHFVATLVFWFPRMWVNTWRPGRYAVLDDETEQKNAPWVANVSHGPGWVSGSLTDVKQFEAILAQSCITCCLKE